MVNIPAISKLIWLDFNMAFVYEPTKPKVNNVESIYA